VITTPPTPVGLGFETLELSALHGQTDPAWDSVLTDLVQHTPAEEVDYWSSSDLTTWAHETTHGIHGYLRLTVAEPGENGFYLLNDVVVTLAEPPIAKRSVALDVPVALQSIRFDTYVSGDNWDDRPLYLFDEWIAYNNGGVASLARFDQGLFTEEWRDQSGVVEFMAYGLALGVAIERQAPDYFEEEPTFLPLLEHELLRSRSLYARFQPMPEFTGLTADGLFDELTVGDAAALRDFAARRLGVEQADSVFAPL
jgi:hypothetical protein